MPALPLPSRGHLGWSVAAAGLSLATVTAVSVRAVADPSPWLHLKVGHYLLAGNRFGSVDPWSSFAETPYLPTQWLPSIVTTKLYDAFGLPAVAWERAVGIVLLFCLLVHLTRRVSDGWVPLAVTTVVTASAWPSLTERPQLLGIVMLVPVIEAWWATAGDLRARWWLVPYTWVAASCHGLWATGVGIGGVVVLGLLADRRLDRAVFVRLAGVLAGCLAAAAVTPLGPRLLLTPITVGRNGRQFVQEWLPSSVRSPTVALTLAVLAAVWLLWVTRQHTPPRWQLLLLLLAVAFALVMQRTVPVAALIVAPMLAGELHARRALATERRPRPALVGRRERLVWAGAAIIVLVAAVPLAAARAERPVGVPTALAQELRRLPENSVVIGYGDLTGWLMVAAPQLRPAYDIRSEVYSADHIERFIEAMAGEHGWEGFVSETGARAAVLPIDSPLGLGLRQQLGWTVAASDGGYLLLEKAS